jgi:hypothetical protein
VSAFLKRKSVRLVLAAVLAYAGTVAATGKFDPAELLSQLAKVFAQAPSGAAPAPDAGTVE